MVKDEDYYDKHRNLFREALKKAQEDIDSRPIERERSLSIERAKNEAKAKELLERHKAKMDRIKIERPYLESQEINDAEVEMMHFSKHSDEEPVNVTLSNSKYRNDGFNET